MTGRIDWPDDVVLGYGVWHMTRSGADNNVYEEKWDWNEPFPLCFRLGNEEARKQAYKQVHDRVEQLAAESTKRAQERGEREGDKYSVKEVTVGDWNASLGLSQ